MTIEDLKEYGLEEMTSEGIHDFLANERYGVLGFSTDTNPYLLPMAFEFDGESNLYFSYFVGSESTKEDLTEQADNVSFLVYSPDSVFYWESVQLTGTLTPVPQSEWDTLDAVVESSWNLALFKQADTAGRLKIYRFEITEQVGLKATGIPPGMEEKRAEME